MPPSAGSPGTRSSPRQLVASATSASVSVSASFPPSAAASTKPLAEASARGAGPPPSSVADGGDDVQPTTVAWTSRAKPVHAKTALRTIVRRSFIPSYSDSDRPGQRVCRRGTLTVIPPGATCAPPSLSRSSSRRECGATPPTSSIRTSTARTERREKVRPRPAALCKDFRALTSLRSGALQMWAAFIPALILSLRSRRSLLQLNPSVPRAVQSDGAARYGTTLPRVCKHRHHRAYGVCRRTPARGRWLGRGRFDDPRRSSRPRSEPELGSPASGDRGGGAVRSRRCPPVPDRLLRRGRSQALPHHRAVLPRERAWLARMRSASRSGLREMSSTTETSSVVTSGAPAACRLFGCRTKGRRA